MKYWLPACLVLLGGCGDRSAPPGPGDANQQVPVTTKPLAGADDGKVECATGGAQEFARLCTIERSDSRLGRVLTLRAPDGGFRRLLITRDGRGVVAADGAEAARVTILSPDRIEVAIGRDRYRLPAAMKL